MLWQIIGKIKYNVEHSLQRNAINFFVISLFPKGYTESLFKSDIQQQQQRKNPNLQMHFPYFFFFFYIFLWCNIKHCLCIFMNSFYMIFACYPATRTATETIWLHFVAYFLHQFSFEKFKNSSSQVWQKIFRVFFALLSLSFIFYLYNACTPFPLLVWTFFFLIYSCYKTIKIKF